MATRLPKHVEFRKTSLPGASQYEVLHKGDVIGRVARFQFGVGQFGARWIATTPGGVTSGKYPVRDAAAAWLIEQAGSGDHA